MLQKMFAVFGLMPSSYSHAESIGSTHFIAEYGMIQPIGVVV